MIKKKIKEGKKKIKKIERCNNEKQRKKKETNVFKQVKGERKEKTIKKE